MTSKILLKVMRDLREAFPDAKISSYFDFNKKYHVIKLVYGPTALYYVPDPKAFEGGYNKEDLIREVENNFSYEVDAWAEEKPEREEQVGI